MKRTSNNLIQKLIKIKGKIFFKEDTSSRTQNQNNKKEIKENLQGSSIILWKVQVEVFSHFQSCLASYF